MTEQNERSVMSAIGPGLVFAGAAVGVSHLVQSTKAGATYGLSLLLFTVLAMVFKYAAFRFGPHYAAATGTSLLEGYRRQGTWVLGVFALITLGTMFTVQAAVTIVTAGLIKASLGLDVGVIAISAVLLVVLSGVLGLGQYQWLDRLTKLLVPLLTVCTLVATALAIPRIEVSTMPIVFGFGDITPASVAFIAALVGWMPSPVDIAAWQSLWTLARAEETGRRPSLREAVLDYHVGYIGTGILAVCFTIMGAAVMYGSGVTPAANAGAFAVQIVDLYRQTLGDWSAPIISVAATAVMISTTVTVLDGYPRAAAVLLARFKGPETPDDHDGAGGGKPYWITLGILAVGSLGLIAYVVEAEAGASMKKLVNLATTISFVTAPLLAYLNHRAIQGDEVPEEMRPSPALRAFSMAGIAFLSVFTLGYLWITFGR